MKSGTKGQGRSRVEQCLRNQYNYPGSKEEHCVNEIGMGTCIK